MIMTGIYPLLNTLCGWSLSSTKIAASSLDPAALVIGIWVYVCSILVIDI